MAEQLFIVGDRVICTMPPGTDQLDGTTIYVVTHVHHVEAFGEYLIAVNKWRDMLWNQNRFRKVTPDDPA